jgi:hypothetical protein
MSQEFYLPATDQRFVVIQRVARVLENLPVKRWKIAITEAKPRRSDPQNRYLWGVVYPTILQAGRLDGWTADDLHDYLLGEHFGWELVEGFGKKRQRPVRRSSKLNKQEFMDYVAFIQQRMAEHGIYVPDPNE